MNGPTDKQSAFVAHLEELTARADRAALAALRGGLSRRPGEAVAMYPHVVPWLSRAGSPSDDEAYFLVAALFALYPLHSPEAGDLGASFARLAASGDGGGPERRFLALLDADREDLPTHLRHAVALLKGHEITVDWAQLLADVLAWDRRTQPVQRRWARSFWGSRTEAEGDTAATEGESHVS